MRCVVVPAEGPPRIVEVPDDEDAALAVIQEIVGGYAEQAPAFVTGYEDTRVMFLWNEEGKLLDLLASMTIAGLGPIYGSVVAIATHNGHEWASLPEPTAQRLVALFERTRSVATQDIINAALGPS